MSVFCGGGLAGAYVLGMAVRSTWERVYDSGRGNAVRFMAGMDVRLREAQAARRQGERELALALGRVSEAQRENARLRRQLGVNSENSSTPASKERLGSKPPKKKLAKSKRRGGAQLERSGTGRELRPVSELTEPIHDVFPESCAGCGLLLHDHSRLCGAPGRSQQTEIEVIVHVREFRSHAVRCRACKHVTRGRLSAEQAQSFGPELQSQVASMSTEGHMSRSKIRRHAAQIWKVKLSNGAITNILKRVGAACEPNYEPIRGALMREPALYADETPWSCAGKGAYAWVAASEKLAVFAVGRRRSADEARALLAGAQGAIHTDRYKGYSFLPDSQHQLCWEHLKRNFNAFTTHEDLIAGEFGARGYALARHIIIADRQWPIKAKLIKSFKAELDEILALGARHEDTRGMATDLRGQLGCLWHFAASPHVHATNNLAERTIRQLVIKRKISQGSGSAAGADALSYLLTTVATCQLQGKPAHAALKNSLLAYLRGQPPPHLV